MEQVLLGSFVDWVQMRKKYSELKDRTTVPSQTEMQREKQNL